MTEPAAVQQDLSVVRVDETTWRLYRDVRLAMLRDAPRAFWTTYDEAAVRTDEEWRALVRDLHLWLAMARGRAVGSVGLHRSAEDPGGAGDKGVLVGLWVDPSARGAGVGERLVLTVLDEARDLGLRRVVLEVAHENARAVSLYERMGFVATGATGALPHDPSITELEMQHALS